MDLNIKSRWSSILEALPPPPALDSPEQARDLEGVLRAQRLMDSELLNLVIEERDLSVFQFARVLGEQFNPSALPVSASFFGRLFDESVAFVAVEKELWKRPRPFAISDRVTVIGKSPTTFSYPSGNSMLGALYASILTRMLPQYEYKLSILGSCICDARVTAGVHFPTDIEAGRLAATLLISDLTRSRSDMADFENAAREIRIAFGLFNMHSL